MSLLLDLDVLGGQGAKRSLEVTIRRAYYRFAGPISEEISYDSNYPEQVRSEAAFHEARKALDVIPNKVFEVELNQSTGDLRTRGLVKIRQAILARVSGLEAEVSGPGFWSRKDGLELCAATFSGSMLQETLTQLLLLPSAEGPPRLNSAHFEDGHLRWAVCEGERELVKGSLKVIESLYAADLYTNKKGVSLGKVAREVLRPSSALATINRLGSPHVVRTGNTLLVPGSEPPVTPLALVEVVPERTHMWTHPWGALLDSPARGVRFVLLERAGEWARVGWGGASAWARVADLREVKGAAVEIVSGSRWINVRNAPSKQIPYAQADIGSTRKGLAYAELDRAKGWVKVQFDGREGWIEARLVRSLALSSKR